jgi:REP element-mobilizing transposase RayT
MTDGRGTRDQTIAGPVGATGRSPLQTGPHRHHRRSIRLRGYDYSQAGAYFVTVCVQGREPLFGDVVDGEMRLNDAGQMVAQCWQELPAHFPHLELDEFVVMPNHMHGIIIVGAPFMAPYGSCAMNLGAINPGAINRAPTGLGEIVRSFKAVATRRIRQAGVSAFAWQRNYYEHIIRDEESLNRIREYIANNPLQWAFDRENTDRVNTGRVGVDAGAGSEPTPGGRRSPAKDEPWRV